MMESRIEQAAERHSKGYNCAQAVFCTYCDLVGIDEETAFKMSEGFGAGMGGLQDTCGAVTGMFMVISAKNSGGLEVAGKTKAKTYALIKKLGEEFREMNSSIMCRDLLGVNGKKLRSCPGCIEDACKLVEKYLFNEEQE